MSSSKYYVISSDNSEYFVRTNYPYYMSLAQRELLGSASSNSSVDVSFGEDTDQSEDEQTERAERKNKLEPCKPSYGFRKFSGGFTIIRMKKTYTKESIDAALGTDPNLSHCYKNRYFVLGTDTYHKFLNKLILCGDELIQFKNAREAYSFCRNTFDCAFLAVECR